MATSEAPPAAARAAARRFDPRRPGRLSDGHLRALRLVSDTLARRLSLTLAARLRVVADVGAAEIRQLTYGEYIGAAPDPALLNALSLPPFLTAGVLQLSLPIALACVERLCGGAATGPGPSGGEPAGRALTEIEHALLASLLNNALADVAAAFRPLLSLNPSILRHEARPALLKAAPPATPLVVMSLPISIGECNGQLDLALPFAGLEPALDTFDGTGPRHASDTNDPAPAPRLAASLLDVPIELTVRVKPVTLTPDEIVELAVGDVLTLHHHTNEPLDVLAGGVPCLVAVLGRRGRRLACRIVESAEEMTR